MNFQDILETFNSLSTRQKIKYIYEKLNTLTQEYQTHLLLAAIKDEKTSPAVLSAALKFLPKSGYRKRELFQQFQLNPHPAVSRAAKRALDELSILEKREISKEKPKFQKKEIEYEKMKKLKILKEMGKINASWVPKVLLEYLEDSSYKVRDLIVNELARREDLNLNTVHQKLLENPWFRKSAILKLLAHKKNPASVDYIEGILEDPNSEVRKTAALTLGEIGGDKAKELLVRLTKDKNHHVRKSAQEALEKASTLKFL